VETTFNVTGRPAQFGRGVMAEVGAKLIDRFAENLAALFAEPAQEQQPAREETAEQEGEPAERHLAAVPEPDEDVRPSGTIRTSRTPDEEALDLLDIAGAPLLKRVAPVLGGLAVLLVLIWVIRRLMR